MSINPLFLFVLFSLGYVFGLLLRNPTAGKFLIFGFAGIFVYEPVKEAGLLASVVFIAGIISHHITPSSLLNALPRFPRSSPRPQRMKVQQRKRRGRESAEDTEQRYEEYVRGKRGKQGEEDSRGNTHSDKAQSWQRSKTQGENRKKPQSQHSKEEDALQRERERLRREKERLEAERRKFDRDRQEQKAPPDTRTDEQILNLRGDYTLADLKKARNAEVKRWNTSNMRHKPPHLIKEAEEEAKKINLAYERLARKFRKKDS